MFFGLFYVFICLVICLEEFNKIKKYLSGCNRSFIQTPGPFLHLGLRPRCKNGPGVCINDLLLPDRFFLLYYSKSDTSATLSMSFPKVYVHVQDCSHDKYHICLILWLHITLCYCILKACDFP